MQNNQVKPSLWEIEQELSELNIVLREKIGEFLWRDMSSISPEFIQKFNGIREDVLSKLPWEVQKYFLAKEEFSKRYAIQQQSKPIKKGKRNKWIWPFPKYTDPKVPLMSLEGRKMLLEFSDFLTLESEWKKVPEDVLIRAILMIQKRAIVVLENRDSDTCGLSQVERDIIRDRQRMTGVYNFLHRRGN